MTHSTPQSTAMFRLEIPNTEDKLFESLSGTIRRVLSPTVAEALLSRLRADRYVLVGSSDDVIERLARFDFHGNPWLRRSLDRLAHHTTHAMQLLTMGWPDSQGAIGGSVGMQQRLEHEYIANVMYFWRCLNYAIRFGVLR